MEENPPAVAANVAVELWAGTLMATGTERFVELELTWTVAPPAPAAAFKLTMQDVEARGARDDGLQVREVTFKAATTGWMLPPVAETGIAEPARDAPSALLRPIVVWLVNEDRENVTVATAPFAMMLPLTPEATHV